jgi:hypothetical protein
VKLAEEHGLFSPFKSSGTKHRMSLFADNVVILMKPSLLEAEAAL